MTSPTVLVDLRACQFNGDRGIPAYAQSLTAELIRRPTETRWLLLRDPRWPLPSRADDLEAHARWCTVTDLAGPHPPPIDAVLTGCFFLPQRGCGADFLLPACLRRQRPRRLGIVYDLVPLLFPDRYLAADRIRRQYLDSLSAMRQSDWLFAISRASRHDAIRHAAVDPARIDCIYGDIDHRKRMLMERPAAVTAGLPAAHGLTGRYCLCIGGDDWRKNLKTTVAAFADFHAAHPDRQLAIVCTLSEERIAALRQVAAAAGLPQRALVCTGYVSDEVLVGLMQHAEMLVYPSLYEGLGLPVLEAHACGIPVVGSATSSIKELVLPELGCDPTQPDSIATAMTRLAASPTLQARSLAHGRRLLAEELGWDRAADRILERLAPRSPAATRPRASQPGPARHRLAVVAALPPARTGIAAYTLAHLQGRRWETVFYEAGPALRPAPQPELLPGNAVVPTEAASAALQRDRHDTAIFVLGNSAHHVNVLNALMRSRGTLPRRLAYLHEAALDGLFKAWLGAEAARLPAAEQCETTVPWIRAALDAKPAVGNCLRFLAERGELDGLIVNSAACRELIRAAVGPLADRWTIDLAFLPVARSAEPPCQSPPLVATQPLRIGSFGLAGDSKRLDLLARTAGVLARRQTVELVIAGWEARRYCRRLQIPAAVRQNVIDAPDDASLAAAMQRVHVAVQLRSPTFGESSGAVSRLLGLGTPLVVADVGSFRELPAELATRVAAGCTADDLALAIETAARRRPAAAARSTILADWSAEAFEARLADILEPATLPLPAAVPESLRRPHLRQHAATAAAGRGS